MVLNPKKLFGKRKRGRPVKYPMQDPSPDTPENVARAIFNTPPKKKSEWEFMKRYKEGKL